MPEEQVKFIAVPVAISDQNTLIAEASEQVLCQSADEAIEHAVYLAHRPGYVGGVALMLTWDEHSQTFVSSILSRVGEVRVPRRMLWIDNSTCQ